jgi:hypothetical protein
MRAVKAPRALAGQSGHLGPYAGAEVSMAGPYSRDLRSRVLAAMEAGATPEAAAGRFAVARSTAYRWAAAARDEGRREAKPMGGAPRRASAARPRRSCWSWRAGRIT